jgi:hypothetical protein
MCFEVRGGWRRYGGVAVAPAAAERRTAPRHVRRRRPWVRRLFAIAARAPRIAVVTTAACWRGPMVVMVVVVVLVVLVLVRRCRCVAAHPRKRPLGHPLLLLRLSLRLRLSQDLLGRTTMWHSDRLLLLLLLLLLILLILLLLLLMLLLLLLMLRLKQYSR